MSGLKHSFKPFRKLNGLNFFAQKKNVKKKCEMHFRKK